jgi:molecular chaperone HscB
MDPFATLGAERRYDLDLDALEKRHRELSRALHPDKFAQAGASERRAALEKAASVNEAWRIVRDPIRRAEALFELEGIAVGETREPPPDPDFLMEMLEMREALSEARAKKDLEAVRKAGREIASRRARVGTQLAVGFERGGDFAKLVPLLGELRFYRRFLEEVSAIEDEAAPTSAERSSASEATGGPPAGGTPG